MEYPFRYPTNVAAVTGRSRGLIAISEDHFEDTNQRLYERLGMPHNTVSLVRTLPVARAVLWSKVGATLQSFAKIMPGALGASFLTRSAFGLGTRFLLHKRANGAYGTPGRNIESVVDRLCEVIEYVPYSRLIVTDVEVADPTVSGRFPVALAVDLCDCEGGATEITIQMTALIFSRMAEFELVAMMHKIVFG